MFVLCHNVDDTECPHVFYYVYCGTGHAMAIKYPLRSLLREENRIIGLHSDVVKAMGGFMCLITLLSSQYDVQFIGSIPSTRVICHSILCGL